MDFLDSLKITTNKKQGKIHRELLNCTLIGHTVKRSIGELTRDGFPCCLDREAHRTIRQG